MGSSGYGDGVGVVGSRVGVVRVKGWGGGNLGEV